jgi:hypothetical protein
MPVLIGSIMSPMPFPIIPSIPSPIMLPANFTPRARANRDGRKLAAEVSVAIAALRNDLRRIDRI